MSRNPAHFWCDHSNGDKQSLGQQRRLQELVLTYLNSKHPDIYLGEKYAHFNSKDGEKLLKQIKRSISTFDYLYCIRFLIKGLETGIEQLGWTNVTPPHMPVPAPREPARFTPLIFRSLHTLQPLHETFMTYLEQPCTSDPSRHFGIILLSAVLYGGLLDKNWLTPLLRGLQDRVRMHGGLMWIDMQRPYIYPKTAGQPEKRKCVDRRWLPDPLTQAMIMRLHTFHAEILPDSQKLDALISVKTVLHLLCDGKNSLYT